MDAYTGRKERETFIQRLRSQGVNIQFTSKKKKELKPFLDLDFTKWRKVFH